MVRSKDESGNCLVIFAVIVLLLTALVMCGGGIADDCYHTPGAQPGSAQDSRDQERCIRG